MSITIYASLPLHMESINPLMAILYLMFPHFLQKKQRQYCVLIFTLHMKETRKVVTTEL